MTSASAPDTDGRTAARPRLTRVALVRRAVIAVNVVGIAGMIVTSILNRHDGALAFGLMTAIGSLCLLVATAVAPIGSGRGETDPDALARSIDERLTAAGERPLTEEQARDLVRDAVRLGRALGPPRS